MDFMTIFHPFFTFYHAPNRGFGVALPLRIGAPHLRPGVHH